MQTDSCADRSTPMSSSQNSSLSSWSVSSSPTFPWTCSAQSAVEQNPSSTLMSLPSCSSQGLAPSRTEPSSRSGPSSSFSILPMTMASMGA